MVIADKLKALRELKNMSQGDIEKRTGCCAATFRASRTATRSFD
jgi:transcriptional regulator with XRE-family HTH domain